MSASYAALLFAYGAHVVCLLLICAACMVAGKGGRE